MSNINTKKSVILWIVIGLLMGGTSFVHAAPNGRNVTVVQFSGGSFEQITSNQWQEFGAESNAPRFTFQETHRDDWSVYLLDQSRQVRIQLDLHRRWIRYADQAAPNYRDLYQVTGADDQTAPNGRNVTVVQFSGGSFKQVTSNQWQEFGAGSNAPRFTFQETHRDDWSVYLLDQSRQVRIQLDLHRRWIRYADQAAPNYRDLYQVTGADDQTNVRIVRAARSDSASSNDFDSFAKDVTSQNKQVIDALISIATRLMQGPTARYLTSHRFQNDVEQRRFNQIERQLGIKALRTRLGNINSPMLPRSFTIGFVADGGVGIGGNLEHGVAVNLTDNGPLLDIYRTFGISVGLITGGSGSVVVSLWKQKPRSIVGESKGLSFAAGKVVNPVTGLSLGGGLGFWFSTLDEFPGGLAVDFREFQGLSVSVGAGASVLPVDLRGTSALTQVYKAAKHKFEADDCGSLNIRPCHVVERFPSCDLGLDEDFIKHRCIRVANSAVQAVHGAVKDVGKAVQNTIKQAASVKKIWVGNFKPPKAYRRACENAGMKFSHDLVGYSYCK